MMCLRPCRMGKTTTLNTISAILQGNQYKELFKGTSIYNDYLKNERGEYIDNSGRPIKANSEDRIVPVKYNWEQRPVFEISFMEVVSAGDEKETVTNIITRIVSNAIRYGLEDELGGKVKGEYINSYLITLFSLLFYKFNKNIIVLIDEYDHAFHEHLYDNVGKDQKKKNIEVVMGFYRTLKFLNENSHIRSIFVTGTTNNFPDNEMSPLMVWEDFTLDPIFADLIGFTEQEILSHFSDQSFKYIYADTFKRNIDTIKDEDMDKIKEKVMTALKKMYDGYRFTTEPIHVFNSESILKCFKHASIENYWPQTVSTEFQWRYILQSPKLFEDFLKTEKIKNIKKGVLIGCEAYLDNEYNKGIAASYQTGLLTIESYNEETKTFNLKISNGEVRENSEAAIEKAKYTILNDKGERTKTDLIHSIETDNWPEFLN
eukprot:GAHX01001327.1.p1 GENE.GAHX01001327.1~~GAHX01001327.1.p1  ORF type:complete len:431 (+),score=72.76 GAHX01001327.1:257-1549(+)